MATSYLGRRFTVRTTHGAPFRRAGITFEPDTKTITVGAYRDLLRGQVSESDFLEILETGRPRFVLNTGKHARIQPVIASGRVLAVADAETGAPLHPRRDMEAIAAGLLDPAAGAGDADDVEPAVRYARDQRLARHDAEELDDAGDEYEVIV